MVNNQKSGKNKHVSMRGEKNEENIDITNIRQNNIPQSW